MLSKDKRLPKQLGDFGEQLVMFVVGRLYGHRVAYVDHVGADIIATDHSGNKYAISVKSRVIPLSESIQQPFDINQQEKLRDFADSFDLIPMVAFVFCDEISYTHDFNLDVYIIGLDDFILLAKDDHTSGITTGKDGTTLHFSNARKNQHILQNHKLINFQRLVFKANAEDK